MDTFITQVGSTITSLATSFATALGNLSDCLFTKASEGGAITGLSTLGMIVAVGIGLSLLGSVVAIFRRFLPRGR